MSYLCDPFWTVIYVSPKIEICSFLSSSVRTSSGDVFRPKLKVASSGFVADSCVNQGNTAIIIMDWNFVWIILITCYVSN